MRPGAWEGILARIAVQIEALKRYLTGAKDKVTTQHGSVNEGGQAIVGADLGIVC
jgi:hypothetical protein